MNKWFTAISISLSLRIANRAIENTTYETSLSMPCSQIYVVYVHAY